MKGKTLIRGIKELKNWPTWLSEYFGFLKNDENVVYNFRNGLNLIARPYTADRGIIQEVMLHKCYDEMMIGVEPGDTVIDIGAQAGYYSAQSLMNGAKKVIAFEPMEDNFILAENNMQNALDVSQYDDQEFVLNNTAVVGSNINELDIYEDSGNSGGHSAFPENDNGGNYVTVPTDNINDIIDQLLEVDVLKCDCEGGEYDIIFNMTDDNLNKVKMFVLELHPLGEGKMPFDITRFLEKKGFTIYTKSQSLSELSVVYAVKYGE